MSDWAVKPTRPDLARLLMTAMQHPWDGRALPIPNRHKIVADSITEPGRPTSIIVTYDHGYHASGWWKNSDFDRCLHMSLAWPAADFRFTRRVETVTYREIIAWGEAMFGEYVKWCWIEPPASVFDPNRLSNMPHIRLFLDRQNQPIKATGEVYKLKPWPDGTSPEKIFGKGER